MIHPQETDPLACPDPYDGGEHWYYLHTNGELIHKRTWPGDDNSPFVCRIWRCDPTSRENAWTIIVEALTLGANVARIRELAAHWNCNAVDLIEFIRRAKPTDELRDGVHKFIDQILRIDPDEFWGWLVVTPTGGTPDLKTMPKPREAVSA